MLSQSKIYLWIFFHVSKLFVNDCVLYRVYLGSVLVDLNCVANGHNILWLQQLARDPTITDILRQQFEFTKDVRALQQLLVIISLSLKMFWFYRGNNRDFLFHYLNDYTLVSFIIKMLNILTQPSNVCWVLWDAVTICKTIV